MPAALYAKAVDAYCTGEPFGAAAQRAGYARPLRMTRDEWRNYICCVLTVREELIAENRPLVQDLVNHVLGAGVWLDAQQDNRNKAVAIAAGRKFFNQDPNILQFVMENPTDRVTYGDLRMIRAEFDDLMQLSIEAGTIKHPIAVRDLRRREVRAPARARRRSRFDQDATTREPHARPARIVARSARRPSRAADGATLKAGVFDPATRGAGFHAARLGRFGI